MLLLAQNIPAGGSDASTHTHTPAPEPASLNARHEGASPHALLSETLRDTRLGRLCLVSSFGADSVVLLHLLSKVAPATPVLFIDTALLFPETLDYQREVAARLGLQDVRVLRAPDAEIARRDPYGALRLSAPDRCCDLRKTQVLEAALSGFDGWISGRKRHQSATRAALPLFEREAPSGRLKINPLANWSAAQVRAYIDRHDLPRHPLVAKGYPSIGCAPCTTRVAPGEDPRAGRWRGQDKTECGIHVQDGRVTRTGDTA